jgi:hypothetical protein
VGREGERQKIGGGKALEWSRPAFDDRDLNMDWEPE